MSKYSDIIVRLEAATGPDRELDIEIAWVSGWDAKGSVGQRWRDGYKIQKETGHVVIAANNFGMPLFTASIDATLELVERMLLGWRHAHEKRTNGTCLAWVDIADDEPCIPSVADTVPLAILHALFRALEAQGHE